MDAFQSLFYDLPVISTEYVRALINVARKKEMDGTALLQEAGLSANFQSPAGARISVRQMLTLLSTMQRHCDADDWALCTGRSLGLPEHNLIAMPLLFRDDPAELACHALTMITLRLPLCRLSCIARGDELDILIDPLWPLESLGDSVTEIYVGTLDRFLSQMNKRYSLQLSHASESRMQRLASALGCRVDHGGPLDRLVIHDFSDGNYLPPGLRPSPESSSLNTQQQQTLLMIRRHIMCDPGRDCTPERVAERLGTTTRTLNRYLSSAGLSFSGIRADVRAAQARHYLAQGRLSISDIADRLGYSDQASFSKAFRGWTGMTPGDFRRNPPAASENLASLFNSNDVA